MKKLVNEAIEDVLKGKDLSDYDTLNYYLKDSNVTECDFEDEGDHIYFWGTIYSPLHGYNGNGQYSEVNFTITPIGEKFHLKGSGQRFTGIEDLETLYYEFEIDKTLDNMEQVANFIEDLGS